MANDDDNPAFSIGELNAKINMILEEQKRMRRDLEELKAYKSKIMGVGASVSFFLMSVGFLFGDFIRGWVKKLVG